MSIENQLSALGKQNAKLERMLAKIGTAADNQHFRADLHREQQESNNQAKSIAKFLKSSTNFTKQQRQKYVAEFESEFKRYQAIQQQLDAKSTHVLHQASKSLKAEGLLESQLNSEENDFKRSGVQLQDIDDIQFVEYDHQEIERRHGQIRQIEKDVVEVAEMFRDLNQLVEQQQEGIDVIENNIQNTKDQVETGASQLEVAAQYQYQVRKRKCIILLILVVIIALIIGLAAGLAKH
jgi:chromosome segregation ATPase